MLAWERGKVMFDAGEGGCRSSTKFSQIYYLEALRNVQWGVPHMAMNNEEEQPKGKLQEAHTRQERAVAP